MGMDGIGGVGALNVSSQTRVTRPQSETVDVNTGSTAGQQQVQVASLPPIGGKGNSNNNGQPGQQQDRGAVQTDKEVAPDKIKAAVDDLNKTVKQASPMHHTQLSFKYHEDTNRISITVTDSDTDEVIREIPPEKTLDMLAKAWEMAGLLVDERR
ncbi:MAG: flagellar protein FlaG [Wujia sp.]|nr:flagellar protein FlaG [Wujia sp.]MDY3727000.1 flagellar protein FlaG [Wujia sp.]